MENSERDGNTRPTDLPLEKPICRSRTTVRTGHGTTEWFQIVWKGVHQGCILSPCLFNLYAEYIMRNAGLEEAQAGIKIAWRNINNIVFRSIIYQKQTHRKRNHICVYETWEEGRNWMKAVKRQKLPAIR